MIKVENDDDTTLFIKDYSAQLHNEDNIALFNNAK